MKNNNLLKYAIPIIMCIFFFRNIILTERDNMDTWMGGGMRMFAKIDKTLYRVAGFNVAYQNQTYFVNLKNLKDFEDESIAARILPNSERLQAILDKAKTKNWCYDKDKDAILLVKDKTKCSQQINIDSIIEAAVYKTVFTNETNRVYLKKIINED